MQVCISLQTDNHANTSPLIFFTGRMSFLPPNQQCQSTEGTSVIINKQGIHTEIYALKWKQKCTINFLLLFLYHKIFPNISSSISSCMNALLSIAIQSSICIYFYFLLTYLSRRIWAMCWCQRAMADMASRHFVTDWGVWRDIKTFFCVNWLRNWYWEKFYGRETE